MLRRIFERLSNPLKLTLCVVSLIGTELLILRLCGSIESTHDVVMSGRADLCEAIAINFSLLAMREDTDTMRRTMHVIRERNEDMLTIGVRRTSGELLVDIGNHAASWNAPAYDRSTESHMIIPISSGTGRWGTIEVQFRDRYASWMPLVLRDPFLRLFITMNMISMLVFYVFFRKVLRQLNPAKVIPGRVRSALDTLTEGLLIIDSRRTIVLANDAFSRLVGRDAERNVGMKPSELPWNMRAHDDEELDEEMPWDAAMKTETSITGRLFDFDVGPEKRKTLVVNASPVFGPNGRAQGVLVSLEDVTPLEQKKRELNVTLTQLRNKSEEIRRQNEELEKLATTDPLTECLNRRSFFKQFEGHWATAIRHEIPVSAIMVDIDFFKSINDNHGHSMGDEVLRKVGAVLRDTARVGDLVCRFGGEEFCVLLPHTDIDDAAAAGERFRVAIEAAKFDVLSITASIGVSSRSLGPEDAQGMIDQADKCLYVAKKNGRNQVVRFDNVPKDLEVDETSISRTKPGDTSVEETPAIVPYRAVAALLSTLAYRHAESASHSRRVADLCVAVSEGLMPPRAAYTLEMAALLHDIGKMGVPDKILLKAGPLTPEEWDVMRHHDRVGVEIVRAAFDCKPVFDIVATYRAHFGGTRNRPGVVVGKDIPLGARILSIADAWDAMTTDRPWRKALTHDVAIQELRTCGGSQFDPELIERFISVVKTRRFAPGDRFSLSTIPRDSALSIGQQIERLTDALETQDIEGIKTLASRLREIATQDGLQDFAVKAEELETSILSDGDLLDVLSCTQELIDLCRTTHSSWLRVSDHQDEQLVSM